MPKRATKTSFKKGQSGNPNGRSKEFAAKLKEISQLAREHCPEALQTLVDIMRTGEESNRLRAAIAVIERGCGKPKQELDVTARVGMMSDEELDAQAREILERKK